MPDSRNTIHPEDREQDEYELDLTTNVFLPKIILGGFILTLWSAFEVSIADLAYYAYKERGTPLMKDPFRRGDFLAKLDEVFTQGLGVAAYPDSSAFKQLEELRLFRHALIHHDGKVSRLPKSLQKSTPDEYEAIGLHFYEDMRHQYVVPKLEFARRALNTVLAYLIDLSQRLYVSAHPFPLPDA